MPHHRGPMMQRALKHSIVTGLALGILMLGAVTAAFAQTASKEDADVTVVKDVPSVVTSRMQCKTLSGDVTRRSFAGGYVFSQTCTTTSNQPVRLVFASDQNGANARLLLFHRPEGRRIAGLGNVVFSSASNEISGTVGRLTRRICRAEGRWVMEGKHPSPSLVYWRQTADCDGKTGWQVIVNRKSPQR